MKKRNVQNTKGTGQFVTINVSIDPITFEIQELNNVRYYVAPAVIAEECVMNDIFYPAKALELSTNYWNGRPVVFPDHPETVANTPDVLDTIGVGMMFNTAFDSETTKLSTEVWIREDEVKNSESLQNVVQGEAVMEVSTGLNLNKIKKKGICNGKKYTFTSNGYVPEHLALLEDKKGAYSVSEGAGLGVKNSFEELTFTDKMNILRNAVKKALKFTYSDGYLYSENLTDNYFMYAVEKYTNASFVVQYYRMPYAFNGIVADIDIATAEEVERLVTYEVIPVTVIANKNVVTKNKTEESTMDKAKILGTLIENSRITKDESVVLNGMDDKAFEFAVNKIDTLSAKNEEKPPVTTPPTVPAKPEAEEEGGVTKPEINSRDADRDEWSKNAYVDALNSHVETVMASEGNEFAKNELEAMPMKDIARLAKLVGNSEGKGLLERNGAGTTANKADMVPLVPASVRNAKK